MNNLTQFSETRVDESQIDSLGHMNVRYYIERADAANRQLMAELGVVPGEGQLLRRVDTYTRFLREQFAGATLITSGGVIAEEAIDGLAGVRSYMEIRNPETGDLAATFMLTSALIDAEDQSPQPTEVSSALSSSPLRIRVPEYGLPRSLSLIAPKAVSMAEIDAAVGDDLTPGMMSGRREAIVFREDCDERGRLNENMDLMFVLHRPMPGEDLKQMGPPLMRDEQGRRFSFAMMETRSVIMQRPYAEDHILSIGADIAVGEKWRQSRRWMFNKNTSDLLGISDSVGVCIDLDARRAIPLPSDVRAAVEKNLVPHLV